VTVTLEVPANRSNSRRVTSIVTSVIALAILFGLSSATNGAGPTGKADEAKYTLRYRFKEGETVLYEVTHIAKTKTRLRGIEEVSQVHTVSEKVWNFQAPTTPDKMKFEHSVAKVELMQQTGEKPEIRWDSTSGGEPPVEFEKVAEQLGTPLSTVSIDARGQEVARETHAGSESQLGMGGLTLSLPEEPIAIGGSWNVPKEVKVRGESGDIRAIKIREVFTLEKVETGVATLSIRSEVLTPIEDGSVKAQVVQQLSNGSIRFDIDGGRVLSKQLDWDESVVGFQGANSLMEYRARMTETIAANPVRTAKR